MSKISARCAAVGFFYRHAGFSWNLLAGETREEGRKRCARALADAEERGTAAGFVVEWEEDQDADTSWLETSDYDDDDRAAARFYSAVVRDAAGMVRASLGGIHCDARDRAGFERYRRVVRAELFAEALAAVEGEREAAECRARSVRTVLELAESGVVSERDAGGCPALAEERGFQLASIEAVRGMLAGGGS